MMDGLTAYNLLYKSRFMLAFFYRLVNLKETTVTHYSSDSTPDTRLLSTWSFDDNLVGNYAGR